MSAISNIKEKINFPITYHYAILLFAFALPLSRAIISFFIIFFPLLWILEGNLQAKFSRIKQNKALLTLLVFCSIMLISVLWSEDKNNAIRHIRMLFYMFSLFVLATSLNHKYILTYISTFLAGMFISEILAYGIFFDIWHINGKLSNDPTPFMMHIDYSVFLAITSLILLNRLMSKHYDTKEKLFFALFFLSVTGNLFINTGRTGQVAYIAGILVMSVLHFRLSFKSFLISSLLLVTIFAAAYNISPIFHKRVADAQSDIQKIFNGNLTGSLGQRVAYWIVTANIVKEHPFGVGIGSNRIAIEHELEKKPYSYLASSVKKFLPQHHPHNEYLLILLNSGFIGLIAFFIFIYYFFKLKIQDPEIKELSVIFMTVYLVSCLTEPLFIKQFTAALFVFFISMFISASLNEQDKEQ